MFISFRDAGEAGDGWWLKSAPIGEAVPFTYYLFHSFPCAAHVKRRRPNGRRFYSSAEHATLSRCLYKLILLMFCEHIRFECASEIMSHLICPTVLFDDNNEIVPPQESSGALSSSSSPHPLKCENNVAHFMPFTQKQYANICDKVWVWIIVNIYHPTCMHSSWIVWAQIPRHSRSINLCLLYLLGSLCQRCTGCSVRIFVILINNRQLVHVCEK